jgi:hypothetical protein
MTPVGASWLANSAGLPATASFAGKLAPTRDRRTGYFDSQPKDKDFFRHPAIKTGTYLAFYNVLKIPMALSSNGQTNRSRKAVSQ